MELKLNFWLFKFVQIKKSIFFYFSRLSILFLLDSLQKKRMKKIIPLNSNFLNYFQITEQT